jgi:hypothetical protein
MLDAHLCILGISEHVAQFYEKRPLQSLFHKPVEEVIKDIFGSFHSTLLSILEDVIQENKPRQLLSRKIDNAYYYIKISKINDGAYIEWEPQ